MSDVSVEVTAIAKVKKSCICARNEMEKTIRTLNQQLRHFSDEWKDDKAKEFNHIISVCAQMLNQPLSELQRSEAFLDQLLKILAEYESIHFADYGGSAETQSSGRQYASIRQGSEVDAERYERMSDAATRNIDYQHGGRALSHYCEEGYRDINGYLRGNLTRELTTDYASVIQDEINSLTDIINERQLGRNMTLYRGVDNPRHIIGDDWRDLSVEELNERNVGRVFQDRGFCSTSVSQTGASDFSQSQTGATIIIQAPEDANGIFVGSYNNRTQEREVLLQRGSNFRIDGISRDQYGSYTIRVTLIGRGAL